jgi:dihydrofolate reductase
MRKIVVGAFVSLDGVMQAPGGPEEDPSGGFKYGGWTAPYWDDVVGAAMGKSFSVPFDLLLGRKTYDIFAAHWPHVQMDPKESNFNELTMQIAKKFNALTKYVATHRPETLSWENSKSLGNDVVATVRELKKGDGPILLTQGSSELVHTLLEHDLVDELRVLTYPLVLGRGKRLFSESVAPGAFKLATSAVSPNGVVIATYERAGAVATGSFALEEPSQAEIERRRDLQARSAPRVGS